MKKHIDKLENIKTGTIIHYKFYNIMCICIHKSDIKNVHSKSIFFNPKNSKNYTGFALLYNPYFENQQNIDWLKVDFYYSSLGELEIGMLAEVEVLGDFTDKSLLNKFYQESRFYSRFLKL